MKRPSVRQSSSPHSLERDDLPLRQLRLRCAFTRQGVLHKPAHLVRRSLLHLRGHVGVGVQREPRAVVSQHTGHRLHIHTVEQGGGCERVPSWHNKDKSENPCGATGWRFVFILFPLKSGPKMGFAGGGEKTGLHLKDKFSMTQKRNRDIWGVGDHVIKMSHCGLFMENFVVYSSKTSSPISHRESSD